MKKPITFALAGSIALLAVPSALGDDPFPGPRGGKVFVTAQTVNLSRAVTNFYAPGRVVVFRALAMNMKTHKYLKVENVRYFYVKIPNQPNVKLRFQPKRKAASGKFVWIGRWRVPTTYPLGVVQMKVLVATKAGASGSFTQMPIPSSQLTITDSPPPVFGPGPTMPPPPPSGAGDVPLYVDTVNGSRPKNGPPRGVGCTQTNVFKQGEQIVVRAFGYDMAENAAVLTPENTTDAHFTVPGQPNVSLAWGGHGTPKVWYWTSFWNIPVDYPLGDIVLKVSYKTVEGKTGVHPYVVTIVPR